MGIIVYFDIVTAIIGLSIIAKKECNCRPLLLWYKRLTNRLVPIYLDVSLRLLPRFIRNLSLDNISIQNTWWFDPGQ